jgi:hypothetical protein
VLAARRALVARLALEPYARALARGECSRVKLDKTGACAFVSWCRACLAT